MVSQSNHGRAKAYRECILMVAAPFVPGPQGNFIAWYEFESHTAHRIVVLHPKHSLFSPHK